MDERQEFLTEYWRFFLLFYCEMCFPQRLLPFVAALAAEVGIVGILIPTRAMRWHVAEASNVCCALCAVRCALCAGLCVCAVRCVLCSVRYAQCSAVYYSHLTLPASRVRYV